MAGTIDQIAQNALFRNEEIVPSSPVFWNLNQETYSGVVEALCDATILIGRPTATVNVTYTLTPNTPWQPMPAGMLCITDIWSPGTQMWKYTLRDMDYTQNNWDGTWQQDVTPQISYSWFPVGFTMFGIWPCVAHAMTVNITGLQSPVQGVWPFSGAQSLNFHDEFFQAIEKYVTHYLRVKEGGQELNSSMELYQAYLDEMKRLTQIEDRRDPYIFSRGVGASFDTGQKPDQR